MSYCLYRVFYRVVLKAPHSSTGPPPPWRSVFERVGQVAEPLSWRRSIQCDQIW
jgi:hypothetical protein